MREDEEADKTARMRRLPGEHEPVVRRQPGYDWDAYGYGPPGRGYPEREYARERGIRASRRTSTWTAAALIAAVAATTGYLAHSIPSTSAGTTTSGYGQPGKSTAVNHGAPTVSGPVVTSGGSGVAAGSRSWKGDN
jgi:hypothetical protein